MIVARNGRLRRARAVAVFLRDQDDAVIDFLGGAMAHYTLGSSYTFVVDRM